MQYNANLAREVDRLVDWPNGIWSRRYQAILRAEREARGIETLGVEVILKQRPHTRPNQTKKSPAPLFHVVAKEVRETFWLMYSTFVAAFREAAEKLKEGNLSARFPVGSFPPGLPFVRAHPARPP